MAVTRPAFLSEGADRLLMRRFAFAERFLNKRDDHRPDGAGGAFGEAEYSGGSLASATSKEN